MFDRLTLRLLASAWTAVVAAGVLFILAGRHAGTATWVTVLLSVLVAFAAVAVAVVGRRVHCNGKLGGYAQGYVDGLRQRECVMEAAKRRP